MAFTRIPLSFTRIDDIDYVSGFDDSKQMLDLFVPAAPDSNAHSFPVAVFVHGGVWALGDRKEVANVGEALAREGILTAVMSYRLAPKAVHPDQIRDVLSAVIWVAAHAAEHRGDPERIVLIGHSAGAHLVSLLALDQMRWHAAPPIAGVVALSGIYDLEKPFGDRGQDTGKEYVSRAFGPPSKVWREASPVHYLTPARDLPFLLVMAERDYPGIRTQTRLMNQAMRKAGWKPQHLDVRDRDHYELVSRIGEEHDRTTEAIAEFVRSLVSR